MSRFRWLAFVLAVAPIRPAAAEPVTDLFAQAQHRELIGAHDPTFDADFDRIEKRGGFVVPEKDWLLDGYMFLHAQRVLVYRDKKAPQKGELVRSAFGFELPTGMFLAFHHQLHAAFRRKLALSREPAKALAAAIEREAVESARVDYDEYLKAAGRLPEDAVRDSRAIALAGEALLKTSRVDPRFDVPFVAGYAEQDGRHIFIDKDVPDSVRAGGRTIPVRELLVVHERVEKALLDEYGLQYQSAHQIALRCERQVARALGISWETYDARMEKTIDEIGKKEPKAVSDRLDLLPYYSYSDAESVELVRKMKASLVRDDK